MLKTTAENIIEAVERGSKTVRFTKEI